MDEFEKIKVVLLGDVAVGKTSILRQFVTGKFSQDSLSTDGADYLCKVIKLTDHSQPVTLQIWDTAGQEIYRSLAETYYKKAAAGIVVYDITRHTTFCKAKVWLDEIKEKGAKDIKIILVGNKSDCIMNEEVKFDEAKEYADSMRIELIISSAKEDINISKIFEDVVKLVRTPKSPNKERTKLKRNKTLKDNTNCC